MYTVQIATIGYKELYLTQSDDLDEIIKNLNQAVLDLNIVRTTTIKESFDDLFNLYLTQKSFIDNAKLNGVFMAGGTIDGKHIEMIFRIVE